MPACQAQIAAYRKRVLGTCIHTPTGDRRAAMSKVSDKGGGRPHVQQAHRIAPTLTHFGLKAVQAFF